MKIQSRPASERIQASLEQFLHLHKNSQSVWTWVSTAWYDKRREEFHRKYMQTYLQALDEMKNELAWLQTEVRQIENSLLQNTK